MCDRCRREFDVRAYRLVDLEAIRDEPSICDRLRRAIDAEIEERMSALDIDDPGDEL